MHNCTQTFAWWVSQSELQRGWERVTFVEGEDDFSVNGMPLSLGCPPKGLWFILLTPEAETAARPRLTGP